MTPLRGTPKGTLRGTREAPLPSVPERTHPMTAVRRIRPPTGVLGAVTAAVESMTWLAPSDAGMVELAKKYAALIDAAEDDPKAVGWLGQNLSGALKSLGGTPAERKALGVEEKVAGKLSAIRARRSS